MLLVTGTVLGGSTLPKYDPGSSLTKIKKRLKRRKGEKKRDTTELACHQLSYQYLHPHTNSPTNAPHKIIITTPHPIFLQKHTQNKKLPFQILHSRSCERPAKTNNSTPLDHLLSRDTGDDVTEHLAMSVCETQYKLVCCVRLGQLSKSGREVLTAMLLNSLHMAVVDRTCELSPE